MKFTTGTIQQLTFNFYTLVLYNNDVKIYAATISRLDAASLIDKYNNQKIKLIK